jgi:hypothetical protein
MAGVTRIELKLYYAYFQLFTGELPKQLACKQAALKM